MQVDLFGLSIRSCPFNDAEELLPSCYRCQTVNPLLNQGGDKCVMNDDDVMNTYE